jgi:hypothetical protein
MSALQSLRRIEDGWLDQILASVNRDAGVCVGMGFVAVVGHKTSLVLPK